MSDQPRDPVQSLFDQAVVLPPEQRTAFLEAACAGDSKLRAEVESLLAWDARLSAGGGAGMLNSPLIRPADSRTFATDPSAGSRTFPLPQFADFRIIREVGKGGMGIVYEAEQVSLGRRVALKVLTKQLLLDVTTRQRFEREAKAAARLHHTNIVPVFGVGEHDGLPYYVMQFIDGTGLDVVIEELARMGPSFKPLAGSPPVGRREVTAIAQSLITGVYERPAAEDGATEQVNPPPDRPDAAARPVEAPAANPPVSLPPRGEASSNSKTRRAAYWQAVARVGLQVAEALEYAHKQGVLHRDVKPSNLLLDSRGTVWVTDFGLAKTDDQQNLTNTGDVIGTLRYMPPEAFEGKSDARGDVYSLGLTLYELAAQTPAFNERDHNRLIKQVTEGTAASIDRVRKGVPRDLVTIIHKAIEREPQQRYQKAEALAEDLRKFLEDRPVQARRVSGIERAARWARRNPMVAGLLGVVAFLLIGVSIASSAVAVRMARLARSEETARQAADEDRRKAVESGDRERWERYRSNVVAAASLLAQSNSAAERALDAAPEEHRSWEWRYFHNQFESASRILPIPEGAVGATLSPDGGQFATASADNTVSLWDTKSDPGQPVHVLRGHESRISGLAYRQDGRRLATASGEGVRIWDPTSGRQLIAFAAKGATSLDFNSGGDRLITAGDDHKRRIWDTKTGKQIAALGDGRPEFRKPAESLTVGGNRVAAIDGKFVRIYDAATGRQLSSLGPHEWDVGGMTSSPGGNRICTYQFSPANPFTVYLWDVDSGNLVARLPDHRAATAVAFNAAGSCLATASVHPELLVRLWDAADGKLLHTLPGASNSVKDMNFSPDGTRFATASMDQTARVWDVRTGAAIAVLRGHSADLSQVIFSPDGRHLVTTSGDHTMRLWDAGDGELRAVLRGHTREPFGQYTPDGRYLLSSSLDGTVRIWDVGLLERSGVLRGHTSFVYDVAFDPTGEQVASVAWDGTARLWDATTGRQTALLRHERPYVTSLAYSHDGRTLATAATDAGATLWDLLNGQRPRTNPSTRGPDGHGRVALSPDGRVLAYARHSVGLYDTVTNSEIARLPREEVGVPPEEAFNPDLAFSPDGSLLVTGASDGTIRLWDTTTWQKIAVLRARSGGESGVVRRLAFSADGKLLASCSVDDTIRLWRPGTREHLASINVGSRVYGLAFSPDGTRLAAGCRDYVIRLFDVATRQEVAELRGHTDYVHAVAWSPDGTRLVSGSGDTTVRIWDSLPVQERARRAAAVPRP